MPSEHANLSASGAELWMNCPGSQHMKTLYPSFSSPAAAEGTLAHSLAEVMIGQLKAEREGLAFLDFSGEYEAVEAKVTDFYRKHPELEGSFISMRDSLEPYMDFIRAELAEADKIAEATLWGQAELESELRVDFSTYVPGGFGTSDVVIVYDNHIEIIDLKYGKGVPVSAVNNPQIRLYALGTLDAYDLAYDLTTVKMVIYQPRLDYVTSEEMSVEELKNWGQYVVAPAAEKAAADTREYHPGEWCKSHFCPAAGSCKARAQQMLDFLSMRCKDPDLLTPAEMGSALSGAREAKSWAADLEKVVLDVASADVAVPGWKVVESRSNRTYSDPDKVATALRLQGYEETMLYEKKLLGVTAMEKVIGKKAFKEQLTDKGLVIKPKGSPTMAPESDKRPAIVEPVSAADFDE